MLAFYAGFTAIYVLQCSVHKESLEFLITPVTGSWQGKHFTLFGMARWMAEHEVFAAAIFVGLSLALIAIFAALERRYKERLASRHKNYFS